MSNQSWLRTFRLYLRIPLVLPSIALAIALTNAPDARAQEPEGWSEVEIIFRDDGGDTEVRYTTITTDIAGTAHLLWLHKQDRSDPLTWTINYARWQDGAWSEPNDVLVAPNHPVQLRVVASPDGILHLTWADQQRLWYVRAPAKSASDAQAWSKPMAIASGVHDADLAIDKDGGLHVAFLTGEPQGPVYYIRSDDGVAWTSPNTVYDGAPKSSTSIHARIAVDQRNRIHVTWTRYQIPEGWPPQGQWYARSEDGGSTWGRALAISRGERGQGDVVAVGNDEIHLVWRGTSIAGNTYHQWSIDGGKTWKGPDVFDTDGGFSGPQNLVADSAGVIHLVRSDGGYQRWQGGVWGPVPALFADSGEPATAAIASGNLLHWINTSSASSEVAFLVHRTYKTGAPAVAPSALPTPASSTALTAERNADPEIESQRTTVQDQGLKFVPNERLTKSAGYALLVGLLPAVILIGIILVIRTRLLPHD